MRFSTFSALLLLVTNVITFTMLYASLATVTPTAVNVEHCKPGQHCTAQVTTK